MWTYEQKSGDLYQNGKLYCSGYSGHGAGVNNPADEFVKNVGPLPCGLYTIEPAHDDPHTGPMSMRLTPDAGNHMEGRGDFLIHGDTAAMNHTASDGCIILPHVNRAYINGQVDRKLTVVETIADQGPAQETYVA
jgi:hypothetical protein